MVRHVLLIQANSSAGCPLSLHELVPSQPRTVHEGVERGKLKLAYLID